MLIFFEFPDDFFSLDNEDFIAELQVNFEHFKGIYSKVFFALRDVGSIDLSPYDGGRIFFTMPHSPEDKMRAYSYVASLLGYSEFDINRLGGQLDLSIDKKFVSEEFIFHRFCTESGRCFTDFLTSTRGTVRIIPKSFFIEEEVDRKLLSELNKIFSFVCESLLFSELSTYSELFQSRDNDCLKVCEMSYLRKIKNSAFNLGNSAGNDYLFKDFLDSYVGSLISILDFSVSYKRDSSVNIDEKEVALAYRALSAFLYNMSTLFIALQYSNVAFILAIRSIELYSTGFLIQSGDIDVRKLPQKGQYIMLIEGESVKGFGNIWYALCKKVELGKNKYLIFDYIKIRNAHFLGHGMEFCNLDTADRALANIRTVINFLDNSYNRRVKKWDDIQKECNMFLEYPLFDKIVEFRNNYSGIKLMFS